MNMSAELSFKGSSLTDGHNIAFPRYKQLKENLGEDSFLASSNSIVVCEGVGEGKFSSNFISRLLSIRHQKAILGEFLSKKFTGSQMKDFIFKTLNQALADYTNFSKEVVENWIMDKAEIEKTNLFNVLVSASTYVSATIVNSGDDQFVQILQEGNSLAILFRFTKGGSSDDSFNYIPIFFTKQMQVSFNCPMQLDTLGSNKPEEFSSFAQPIQEGDLVILGSGGFFDNVHHGFLVMLANSILAFHSSSKYTLEECIEIFKKKYLTIYLQILQKKESVLKDKFLYRRDYPSKEENSLKDKLQNVSEDKIQPVLKVVTNVPSYVNKDQAFKSDFEIFLWNIFVAGEIGTYDEFILEGAFFDFFQCPIFEMISLHDSGKNDEGLMSNCLKEIMKKHFSFAKDSIKGFENKFDQAKISQFLAETAKLFSERTDRYPSPYFINWWKENRGSFKTDITGPVSDGKKDDITVVASLVTLRKDQNPKYHADLLNSVNELEASWLKEFELNSAYFLDRVFHPRKKTTEEMNQLKKKRILNNQNDNSQKSVWGKNPTKVLLNEKQEESAAKLAINKISDSQIKKRSLTDLTEGEFRNLSQNSPKKGSLENHLELNNKMESANENRPLEKESKLESAARKAENAI